VEVRTRVAGLHGSDGFSRLAEGFGQQGRHHVVVSHYCYLLVLLTVLEQHLLDFPGALSQLLTGLVDGLLLHEGEQGLLFLAEGHPLVLLDVAFPGLLMVGGQVLNEPYL